MNFAKFLSTHRSLPVAASEFNKFCINFANLNHDIGSWSYEVWVQ